MRKPDFKMGPPPLKMRSLIPVTCGPLPEFAPLAYGGPGSLLYSTDGVKNGQKRSKYYPELLSSLLEKAPISPAVSALLYLVQAFSLKHPTLTQGGRGARDHELMTLPDPFSFRALSK